MTARGDGVASTAIGEAGRPCPKGWGTPHPPRGISRMGMGRPAAGLATMATSLGGAAAGAEWRRLRTEHSVESAPGAGQLSDGGMQRFRARHDTPAEVTQMLDEQRALDPRPALVLPSRPDRRSVVGAPISVTDYDEAVACILAAARRNEPYLVTALAVHGVVETRSKPELRRAIEDFDIVTPDGQPVRLALNWFHRAGLADRVYGPTLTLRLCEGAAREGVPVYFYGSTAEVVASLAAAMQRQHPDLRVAGAEPSAFRPLTPAESAELGERIRASGAGIVFIGLGCPRQELFAWQNRDIIGRPMVCVGAAFDFHAGTKRQAPAWMQDHALEWLFRLSQEPRRLFRRYAITNTIFVWALVRQWAGNHTVKGVRP